MIDLNTVVTALEAASDEVTTYFDRGSNKVVFFREDDLSAARQDPIANIPEWQQEIITKIRLIENDKEKRFLALPTSYDINEWNIMQQFSLSMTDAAIGQELEENLHGKGAFRMFRHCLHRHNLQEKWYVHRAAALRKIAADWCINNGIKYAEEKIV